MIHNIFLNTEREIRSIWWVAIFFLALLLVLFPLIIIAQQNSFEISIPLQALIIFIISIICQLFRRKPISDIAGKINLTWFKEIFIGAVLGSSLMILPALILTFFGYVNWQTNDFSFSTIISGLSIFLGVAIAEELLFRGFIFQRLIDSLGQWPAQLIIAGLFLLTHINNPGMTGVIKILASINIFIASIMFGIAYIKTKRLAMSLGLHFMANFIQGTILGFGVSGEKEHSLFTPLSNNCPIWISGGEFGLEASIVGLFTVILITTLLYFKFHENK